MTSTLAILACLITIVTLVKLYELYLNPPTFEVEGKTADQLDQELMEKIKFLESKTWALSLFASGTLLYTLMSTVGIILLPGLPVKERLSASLIHMGIGFVVWFYGGIGYAIFMNKANILQQEFGRKSMNYVLGRSVDEIKNKKIRTNGRPS